MAKDLSISYLLDFYGQMLTDKQREVTEFYYNDDLSLAEIADHCHITRQGVRDSIKRAEAQLREYEEKLGLARRFVERSGRDHPVCPGYFHLQRQIPRLGRGGEAYSPDLRAGFSAQRLTKHPRRTSAVGKGRCLWLLKGFREDFPKCSKS